MKKEAEKKNQRKSTHTHKHSQSSESHTDQRGKNHWKWRGMDTMRMWARESNNWDLQGLTEIIVPVEM